MSAWIKIIRTEEASARLKEIMTLAKTPHGTVDNVMKVHSLRPSTMKGHLFLYRAVLHDNDNTIPKWFQETISSYVSILNKCEYSLANHWANACHLIADVDRSNKIKIALESRRPEDEFDGADLALLNYTAKLTLNPDRIIESDIIHLRKSGVSDGEILEANQIVSYFNYVNRTINGLGVTTDGDTVGYYNSG
ncbi:MAG: alkylhydroperoxidase [Rhodobacteraceae bacterium]|nr:MAG: alkylhydroperoxidase [Paracoccaceae bacterium]